MKKFEKILRKFQEETDNITVTQTTEEAYKDYIDVIVSEALVLIFSYFFLTFLIEKSIHLFHANFLRNSQINYFIKTFLKNLLSYKFSLF